MRRKRRRMEMGRRKERPRIRIEKNRERRVKESAMGSNNKQNLCTRGPTRWVCIINDRKDNLRKRCNVDV
jgi:hypothetical protein